MWIKAGALSVAQAHLTVVVKRLQNHQLASCTELDI